MSHQYDVCVIGGGINGVGIAADAAGRGLSVLLCEQADLASATSSYSSKLIHGGIRYLEQFQFRLVRESLQERALLMHAAPFLVRPMPFVLPHAPTGRPGWMIRLGLFLYDHLTRQNQLPKSSRLGTDTFHWQQPLKQHYQQAFCYYDCATDDARLVVLNAMQAQLNGARIATRTRVDQATPSHDGWQLTLSNTLTKQRQQASAKVLVNATGPWLIQTNQQVIQSNKPLMSQGLRLVQGSHCVVPQLYPGEHAYLLQHPDQRVIFVIPFQKQFSLIGTTDTPFAGNPANARITDDEKQYLLDHVNQCFTRHLTEADIVSAYSGVRALVDDGSNSASQTTRDYFLEWIDDQAPLLNVYGGKLTTYRALAEHAVNLLGKHFPNLAAPWTANAILPGGRLDHLTLQNFRRECQQCYSWLTPSLLDRYLENYGDRIHVLLRDAKHESDLGQDYGHGLYQREIDYLKQHEFAQTMEDILWRRTKIGLHQSSS